MINYALPCNASPVILVLGDSLSSGYGLKADESWVALLSDKIKAKKIAYTVVNGSVAGATAADGLSALPNLLKSHTPKILIVALGSNDGLRGNSVVELKRNLSDIISVAKKDKIKVLLVGFKLPVNYGSKYRESFEKVYVDLKKEYSVPLVPFLLSGIETNLGYFQNDTYHPTAAAQPLILNNVWPYLQPMLQ